MTETDFAFLQWAQYIVVPNEAAGRVAQDVGQERIAQNKKWGEQHHPDGTGPASFAGKNTLVIDNLTLVEMVDFFRRLCDEAHRNGTLTWRHILLEEVFEAIAEQDYDLLRKEMVQVAAVAAAWIEDIDWRTARLNNGDLSFLLDGSDVQEIADPQKQIESGLAYIQDNYGDTPLRWRDRVRDLGKYWGFEHKGFSGYGCGYQSIGLGLEFAIGRDHSFIHVRLLDRGVNLQWESGF